MRHFPRGQVLHQPVQRSRLIHSAIALCLLIALTACGKTTVEHAYAAPWLRQTTTTTSVQLIDQTTTKTITVERHRWWGWEQLEQVDGIVGPGDRDDIFVGKLSAGGFAEIGPTGPWRQVAWKQSPQSPWPPPSILEPQRYISLADIQAYCLERNGPGWHADSTRDADDPPGMVKDGPKRIAWGCLMNGVTPGVPTQVSPENQPPVQLSADECRAVARWFALKVSAARLAKAREVAKRQGCEVPEQ
jgi:hypothetical protein